MMSQITVTLVNDTGVAQNFAIYDMKVKPDGPPVAAPFLKPGESVQVTVETGDDVNGLIRWVSEQSGQNNVPVGDGDTVNMSVVG